MRIDDVSDGRHRERLGWVLIWGWERGEAREGDRDGWWGWWGVVGRVSVCRVVIEVCVFVRRVGLDGVCAIRMCG